MKRREQAQSVTTAPESPAQELERRQRRYAIMAALFIASFTAAAVFHTHTVLALLLCVFAIATLVLAVVGANVRAPRRRPGPKRVDGKRRQLR